MLGLIIGGAGSGKSEYAEKLAVQLAEKKKRQLVYLATMMSGSREADERIAKHRHNRAGRGFLTIERSHDLRGLTISGKKGTAEKQSGTGAVVLLEDLGNLLGNEMFLPEGGGPDAVMKGIRHIHKQAGDLIIVANDVFSDGCRYDEETRQYLREMALIMRDLADNADYAAEIVCGSANILKDEIQTGGV